MKNKKQLAVYKSDMIRHGGVSTFTINLIKRLHKHYDITLYCRTYDIDMLIYLSEYANIKIYDRIIEADVIIMSDAWGKKPKLKARMAIQTVHADYEECLNRYGYIYSKNRSTTHHVAVSGLVKEKFELMTPYKIDKVIYNLL